jgi:hypothetical protein
MTIETLFKWAIKHDCEDMHVVVKLLDEKGEPAECWLDEDYLSEHNGSIVIDCRLE